jgi:hypothetical protein
MDCELIWETIVDHEDYEICVTFPHQIRRRKDGYILIEYQSYDGYVYCRLNKTTISKHRIIAIQFLPNPDRLPQVDHKNKIRNDNRIENMRWVSRSENMLNSKSRKGFEYEYFDELPVPCESFDFYNGHDFEGYPIDEEKNIYYHNGLMFRKLQRLILNNKYEYYRLKDIEKKQVSVFVSKID